MGRAIDGYLSNCAVFIDLNGNRLADPDEPTTVTDSYGGFILLAAPPGRAHCPPRHQHKIFASFLELNGIL
jgi:hypothetical protein